MSEVKISDNSERYSENYTESDYDYYKNCGLVEEIQNFDAKDLSIEDEKNQVGNFDEDIFEKVVLWDNGINEINPEWGSNNKKKRRKLTNENKSMSPPLSSSHSAILSKKSSSKSSTQRKSTYKKRRRNSGRRQKRTQSREWVLKDFQSRSNYTESPARRGRGDSSISCCSDTSRQSGSRYLSALERSSLLSGRSSNNYSLVSKNSLNHSKFVNSICDNVPLPISIDGMSNSFRIKSIQNTSFDLKK